MAGYFLWMYNIFLSLVSFTGRCWSVRSQLISYYSQLSQPDFTYPILTYLETINCDIEKMYEMVVTIIKITLIGQFLEYCQSLDVQLAQEALHLLTHKLAF